MNAVLAKKMEEREGQLSFVDELLSKVEADGGRDLVEAEVRNLESARERVAELDAQIGPLEEHEAMRARHVATAGAYVPDRPRADPRPVLLAHRRFRGRAPGPTWWTTSRPTGT